MQKVVIIGGGIVGLMSAYYLSKHKLDITIIDQSNLESTCSTGNAGMIVPSHFTPLAAPGIVYKGFKWMFNPESPFRFYPSLNKDLLSWGWKFYQKANKKHIENSEHPLLNLNLFSKELYQQLAQEDDFSFELKNDGILMLCKLERTLKEEIELAKRASKLGLDIQILNSLEINKLENREVTIAGGVLYKSDAHLTPNILIRQLIQFLKNQKVKFELNQEVSGFVINNRKIKQIVIGDKQIEADTMVLAAGAFSGNLAKKLKIKLPMQGGKGYSMTFEKIKDKPHYPALLIEARVAVTPMGEYLRIGGTMEIGSDLSKINKRKVQGILKSLPEYYPGLKLDYPEEEKIWSALRPTSPDGLPYIGKSDSFENLIVATGHAMMGLSLGPATGKLVEEIVTQQTLSQEPKAFDPNRYN
ncbi:MAG: amino acid dehydrogenase [Bacteroidetes bacterium HGW-Bacteroidetes-17]|jgi:D-amino-acid dehydrogenase|nr:MAG: amino acid dehydrogenase [Bacteroidetes bacterium HGW-Bacteroidetes-17]